MALARFCTIHTVQGSALRSSTIILSLTLTGALLLPAASPLAADDSAFLACAQYADRGQRIACLEDALENEAADAALPEAAGSPAPAAAPSAQASTPARPQTSSAAPTAQAQPASPSAKDTVDNFGRDNPRVVRDDEGQEELHDRVTAVENTMPNLIRVTLASGQVWQQVHPRRYNLRPGNDVRIYSTRWGENFRLESPQLSGFLQVRRLE